MIQQRVELYTAQEQDFLESLLRLFKIDYKIELSKPRPGTLSHCIYTFEADGDDLTAINYCLKANYNKLIN